MEENFAETLELGVLLYEKSNAKSMLDGPRGKLGAKGWAQRIYMVLLGLGLFAWFLYSVIMDAKDPELGVSLSIVKHLGAFFVLLVAETILALSSFGAWGKFARGALKHKVLTHQRGMEGVQTRQLAAELAQADANKSNENAIRIYREYVVVVNDGEETIIAHNDVRNVKCEARPTGYQLIITKYDDEVLIANALVPFADLPLVKKHFDRFEYTPAEHARGNLKKKLPTFIFVLIPVLIGVALIIVHCLVLPQMPIVFGILFVAIGILLVIAQFNDFAVVKHGIMPIGAGLIFMGLPIAVAYTLIDLVEDITLAMVLTSFTEIHAVLALFFGFGPLMIISGIAGIINCIKL